MDINYKVTKDCVTLYNCYLEHKWNMRGDLKEIREGHPDCLTFKRTLFSLKMEWICHKFLYLIGYKREQTKDCDLDYPADHPEWMYVVCGLLTWIFVW